MPYELFTHDAFKPSLDNFINRENAMFREAVWAALYQDKAIFPVSSKPNKKTPLTSNGFHAATTEQDTIVNWWGKMYKGALIGLPTGQTNRIIVLDVDMKNGKDGLASLRKLEEKHGPLPATYTVTTPSGGLHFYFTPPKDIEIRNSVSTLGEGLDVRGDGGYVLAAGSINDDGQMYEITEDNPPIADMPEWFVNLLTTISSTTTAPAALDSTITEGGRNFSLLRLLSSWYGLGVTSEDKLLNIAQYANQVLCIPPMTENEVTKIVNNVMKFEPSYTLDAMGNAERYADRYSHLVKCSNAKDWYLYADGIYSLDTMKSTHEFAKQIAKELDAEAKQYMNKPENNKDIANALLKLSKKTRDNPLALLPLAASDPKIAVDPSEFDRKPNLLNLKNGVIDLDTMEFSSHRPEHLLTKQANASYTPQVKAELWLDFMKYVTNDDQDLIDFFARLYGGVGLFGGNPEQVMVILFGHGKNGKSILADTLRYVMGSYSDVIRQEVLMANSTQNIKHDIADIRGARFLLASEPMPGAKINASIIKELTGGDQIKGRHIYQNSVTFTCEGLITLVTNWEPEIEAGDSALKRRLVFIKLDRFIPEEKRDPQLGEKLRQEADGILSWLVEGRKAYLEKGLSTPPRVANETAAFNTDMDGLEQFFLTMCELSPDVKGQADDLYRAYYSYMISEHQGKNMKGRHAFFKLLARRFQKKEINGRVHYVGLKLKDLN